MESPLLVTRQRIYSIDILRGIIMIIMALDHVRDFYSNIPFDPLDLDKTTPVLFFTRWITHLCAPTFVFLSGISAYLSLSKRSSNGAGALFLLKRGVWLILLEITIIGFGWILDPGFHMLFLQVIWAIGCSMLFLSLLISLRLKPLTIGIIGLVIIFGHNLLDGIKADTLGHWKLPWMLLHQQGFYQLNGYESALVLYPVLPWIGVMAAGYGFGTLYNLESNIRRTLIIRIGITCLLVFLVLRCFNIYGDPFPWAVQNAWWKNVLAIIRCQKYPPSLLYLLITLGISITALGLFEKADHNSKLSRFFLVYGRVPFFYYLLHIYLIHVVQVVAGLSMGFTFGELTNAGSGNTGKWGFGLPVVYAVWIATIAVLYLPCRWFMKYKQSHRQWWLSYI